jgi:putative inorganic carbon (HCO3(-)) transporter
VIYYGLLAFFFLEYVRPATFVPGLSYLKLNSLVPISIGIANLFDNKTATNAEIRAETTARLVLGILAVLVIHVPFAEVTTYAWDNMTFVSGFVLVFWVLAKQLDTIPKIKGVFKMLVLAHIVVAGTTPEMFTDTAGRHYLAAGSFLGDGNDFALSVNIVVALALFLLYDARKLVFKLLALAALLFLVACVVLTQSRGGTLALAALVAYFWMRSDSKLLTGALGVVGLLGVLMLAPPQYFERMNQISTEEGSAQGRILAWQAAGRMARDNPILGVGSGHFPVAYGVRYRPPGGEEVGWQTAHSVYFLVLGELALPGIFLYLTLIISNLVENRRLGKALQTHDPPLALRHRRLLASTSAAMIAFAVGGAFLSAAYYPHIFMCAGLNLAARRIIRRENAAASGATPAAAQPAPPASPVSPLLLPKRPAARPGSAARQPVGPLPATRHGVQ